MTISASKIKKNEKLIAEVEVENTGKKAGLETVHWYISDLVCTISRPMKELKHFDKKEIVAGAKVKYRFEIEPLHDLSYTNSEGKRFLEVGDYFVMVNDQKIKFEIIE